jgi:hypothetical protein
MSSRLPSAATLGLSLIAFVPTTAQQRLGGEFQVNTSTVREQVEPALASDADGDFVVVWEGRDASGGGVFGRRYDASGSPQGGEFRVNTYSTFFQGRAAVASDAEGNFVVVWMSQDGSLYGVFGQRYDASGNRLGGEFRANSTTFLHQEYPAVASDAEGSFVVVWQGAGSEGPWGIFGRRYDASGNPLGGELQVSSRPGVRQYSPAVASDAQAGFVVAWARYEGAMADFDIVARRYDASGASLGSEFRVNNSTPYDQGAPAVTIDGDGDFVVVWQSQPSYYGRHEVVGQRFDAAGNRVGGELEVSANADFNVLPRVARGTDDELVVVWSSTDAIDTEVLGRRMDALGEPIGGEFLVNAYTTGRQERPSVGASADGRFVVAWQSHDQDGDDWGVFGQRFAGPGLALSADGSCPGQVSVDVVNAPPGTEVAVVAAANANGFVKGGALCPGVDLEIGEPLQLPPTFIIVDGSGNGSAILNLQANRCHLQALSLASCETSNTVRVP